MNILMFHCEDINMFDSKMLSLALPGVLCNRQYMYHVTILNSEKF